MRRISEDEENSGIEAYIAITPTRVSVAAFTSLPLAQAFKDERLSKGVNVRIIKQTIKYEAC